MTTLPYIPPLSVCSIFVDRQACSLCVCVQKQRRSAFEKYINFTGNVKVKENMKQIYDIGSTLVDLCWWCQAIR